MKMIGMNGFILFLFITLLFVHKYWATLLVFVLLYVTSSSLTLLSRQPASLLHSDLSIGTKQYWYTHLRCFALHLMYLFSCIMLKIIVKKYM